MIKLKTIISNLDNAIYQTIEEALIKNKADNFLFLLQSYRTNTLPDPEIIKTLDINSNSFYVLKSRLHDKIQEYLSGDIHATKEEVIKQLHQIPDMCLNSPREVTTAFLQKLEHDLLAYDMHNELMVVYSALKKIHLFSEKYFHYSQLYNKHIAFSLSLEKSLEILGNFNRVLGQYHFSRSPKLLETLVFLRKGIGEHYALNQSRQIELMKKIIELQLRLFTNTASDSDQSTEEILNQTQKIINELPDSSPVKNWNTAIDYLHLEYYNKIGQSNQAQIYFGKVNANLNTLMLSTHICVSSLFLPSKLAFLQESGKVAELKEDYTRNFLFDQTDTHTMVLIGIYKAMLSYYEGKYKEASTRLNEILNINSFKDYFHINTEIKLTLVFIYLLLQEFDLADNILKNIYRKIKTEKLDQYTCLLDLIKVFGEDIKKQNTRVTSKQKDHFTLFMARNTGENKLLQHLMFELNKKYS